MHTVWCLLMSAVIRHIWSGVFHVTRYTGTHRDCEDRAVEGDAGARTELRVAARVPHHQRPVPRPCAPTEVSSYVHHNCIAPAMRIACMMHASLMMRLQAAWSLRVMNCLPLVMLLLVGVIRFAGVLSVKRVAQSLNRCSVLIDSPRDRKLQCLQDLGSPT